MHDGEFEVDENLVRMLIAEQFPDLGMLPVRRAHGSGTVNAIFRIGEEYAARLPLVPADAADVAHALTREANAMNEIIAVSPVPTPIPVAVGALGVGYPLPWAIQTWIPGEVATPDQTAHSHLLARDLAALIRSLRSADTRGRAFSGEGRGGNLQDSDEWMTTCFERSEGMLPVLELRAMWRRLRTLADAPTVVMTHGDLTPANLLLDGERLCGVLDGGGFGPADPALDLVAAWHLLDAEARTAFRTVLGPSDLEWKRGAAWAFQQSMGLVWYYAESNPTMSALGSSTLRRLLNDAEIGG